MFQFICDVAAFYSNTPHELSPVVSSDEFYAGIEVCFTLHGSVSKVSIYYKSIKFKPLKFAFFNVISMQVLQRRLSLAKRFDCSELFTVNCSVGLVMRSHFKKLPSKMLPIL